jgi:serine/threonine-protein kinase
MLQNRYRIIKELGEGGFGKTFLAEDTQMPSLRKCVIKQLKPISHNPNIYQLIKDRFRQEAIILEKLGSQNSQIPSLYAYCEEDNIFYLVQEYVEGVTLTNLVQQKGVLSELEVREFLVKILPVFDFVHYQGIIHRDTKPDNLILRHCDQLPILIDFGAVKETMGTMVTNSGTPTSSIIIGSPGFMPSEQSIGRPVYATDIYALGLTAIFLLTGKSPKELGTNQETGEIQWQQYCPNLSPNLSIILNKAIAPNYQNRYLKAKEMLNALQIEVTPTIPLRETEVLQSSPDLPNLNPTINLNPNPNPNPSQNQTLLPTVAVNPHINNNTPSQGLKEWQKALIIGGIIGLSLMGTILLIVIVPNYVVRNENQNNSADNQSLPQENNEVVREEENSQNLPDLSSEPLDVNTAIDIINNLYLALSSKQFSSAEKYYSSELLTQFDPNFFNQFERVTVENLRVISQTPEEVKLIGENTYFYPDGSTQRELRAYTVSKINGEPKITASKFIKVIRFR